MDNNINEKSNTESANGASNGNDFAGMNNQPVKNNISVPVSNMQPVNDYSQPIAGNQPVRNNISVDVNNMMSTNNAQPVNNMAPVNNAQPVNNMAPMNNAQPVNNMLPAGNMGQGANGMMQVNSHPNSMAYGTIRNIDNTGNSNPQRIIDVSKLVAPNNVPNSNMNISENQNMQGVNVGAVNANVNQNPQSMPVNNPGMPGGNPGMPGQYQNMPGGYQNMPGAYQNMPGGYQGMPYGQQMVYDRFAGMDPKTVIKKTRHAAEIPLRIFAFIFTFIFFMSITTLGSLDKEGLEDVTEIVQEIDDSITYDDVEDVAELGFGGNILLIVMVAILLLYSYYELYSYVMSYAVKVTPNNFPEIYAKSVEFATKLGLKKVPDVYIQQSDGVLNAFSTYVIGRKYVVLNAEVVDIAYLEHKDFDSVYFIMAHEFGHIYFHHVNFWLNLTTFGGKFVPIFSHAFSRAQEYSADRVAQALVGNAHSVDSMMMLMAGRHLYKYVDKADYVARIKDCNFLEAFARVIRNVFSTHPIMPFRIKALIDPKRRSGRMF